MLLLLLLFVMLIVFIATAILHGIITMMIGFVATVTRLGTRDMSNLEQRGDEVYRETTSTWTFKGGCC